MHYFESIAAIRRTGARRLSGAVMWLALALSILVEGVYQSVGAEEVRCGEIHDWVFEQGLSTIDSSGGRPCRLEVATISATPVLRTAAAAVLPGDGDFRAAEVLALEFDALTTRSDPGGCGLPFTLVLRSDGGTPTDPADDDFAYHWDSYQGLLIAPCAGEGWLHFRVEIPSADASSLPDGWTGGHHANPLSFRTGVDWNDVITDVDRVELWWGAPSLEVLPRVWVVAVDDIEIETAPPQMDPDRRSADGPTARTRDQGPIVPTTPKQHVEDRP